MKKILILATLFIATIFSAQSMSCNDLVNYAKSSDSFPDVVKPLNSSMIAKAEYYKVDGGGIVIAYLKSNDYDFTGKPYIFCGISAQRWFNFKLDGLSGSYGKAFHEYIREYTCDCG